MTAVNFSTTVLPFTLRFEGGKVDDPRDPGGRTNQGVTQTTFSAWLKQRGHPERDVYTLSRDERDDIYRSVFWNALGGDALPDGVDLVCFDFAVNSGPSRALKTYRSRSSNDPTMIVRSVCAARLRFDRGLAVWNTFKRGWTARVAACEALGLKMAEHARIGVAPGAPATEGTARKLLTEAAAASTSAKAHAVRGTGAVAGNAVAGSIGGVSHASALSSVVLVIIGLCLTVTTVVSFWRRFQQQARASALAAEAFKADAPRPRLVRASPTP